ncbi:MAG: hypothetical protein ACXVX6_15505, partial [Mycobacterium sp.]
ESLLDSIGDPTLILGLLYAALPTKFSRGEMTEVVRLAQRTIDLANGDATKGNLVIGLRAAEARARGDELAYRDYRDRYRAMADSLGFEGHIAWEQAMD